MPDRAAIHAAVDTLLDALDDYRRAPVEEELVRVRDLQIEVRTRAELVRSGRLRTVRLGRETWTRRSWVLAAIESMPRPALVPDEGDDDGVASALARRARRSA